MAGLEDGDAVDATLASGIPGVCAEPPASMWRVWLSVTRGCNARQAVAEYLDGWVPLRLVAEQAAGKRCWLWIEAAHPLPAAAADDYVRGCPGYVPGSFKMLAD